MDSVNSGGKVTALYLRNPAKRIIIYLGEKIKNPVPFTGVYLKSYTHIRLTRVASVCKSDEKQ